MREREERFIAPTEKIVTFSLTFPIFSVYSQCGRLGLHHRAARCGGGTGWSREARLRGDERLWYAEYTLAHGRRSADHVYRRHLSVIMARRASQERHTFPAQSSPHTPAHSLRSRNTPIVFL